jgi:hypothetical protein
MTLEPKENVAMTRQTTLLLIAVVALVALVSWQATVIRAQDEKLSSLASDASAVKERIASALFERQQKCSAQARKEFIQSGFKDNDPLASYQNHYNEKLNKCFAAFTSTAIVGRTATTVRTVFDAFEGKDYGSYISYNPGDKKYWEVVPSKCEVIQPSGAAQVCHSDGEFSVLAKVYLEG